MPAASTEITLLEGFAARTGVDGDRPPRRYLWTDAFAVCTWLGLARSTGEERHLARALHLIDQVHRVLGRHRADDSRRGWLSGLGEKEGAAHPTRAGLRIGKPLPERRADDPLDERLEWDRDGQYFHYLTKWMHALDQAARATAQATPHRFARELAVAAHRAFTVEPRSGSGKRMVWKMSIDLSRPLVPSMGHHDPLDGLVTCAALEETARALGAPPGAHDLAVAMADFAAMVDPASLATADALGVGGLLVDALRLDAPARDGVFPGAAALQAAVLDAARVGLEHYVRNGERRAPVSRRLGFRELGLAIGLAAVDVLGASGGRDHPELAPRLAALAVYGALRGEIEEVWLRADSRASETWLEHQDINEVMLATSLAPEGFLVVRPPGP